MSCRVLGRKVEHMALREILRHARAAGIGKLSGVYRPTDRNGLVIDHYPKLGFTKVDEEASGLTRWELLVEDAEPASAPMKIVSQGFAAAMDISIA
jgi:predicted enzyme involved in methoxymalonyl-ACP biosynthesis